MDKILITVQQAARILGTSESTVRRLKDKGTLNHYEDGIYCLELSEVLARKDNDRSNIVTKFTIDGLSSIQLKKAINAFSESDEHVTISVEEFETERRGKNSYKVFTVYGNNSGTSWLI